MLLENIVHAKNKETDIYVYITEFSRITAKGQVR